MKKVLTILICLGLCSVLYPSILAEDFIDGKSPLTSGTHNVLVEIGSQTGCPKCKYAHAAIIDLYDESSDDFEYVMFIGDKNVNAQSHLFDDFNIGSFPTAYFDGGAEVVMGVTEDNQTQMNQYGDIVDTQGSRTVHDLDVSLSFFDIGDGKLSISYEITNNGDAYSGFLKVLVIEKENSFNWLDGWGNLYTNTFLDYAQVDDLSISAGASYQENVIWDGSAHDDGYGSDFSDVDAENVKVIVAVFSGDGEEAYSVPPDHNPFTAYSLDEMVAVEVSPAPYISDVKTGFGSVILEVENPSPRSVSGLGWSIVLDGGFVLLGSSSSGTIGSIASMGSIDVPSKFIVGFGSVSITSKIILSSSTIDEQVCDGSVFLFFVSL